MRWQLQAVWAKQQSLRTSDPKQVSFQPPCKAAPSSSDIGTLGLLDRANKVDPLTNLPLTTVRDDLGLRASVGISVFWKSPLGPLRFYIAQPVAKEPYDVTQIFRFSTSTQF